MSLPCRWDEGGLGSFAGRVRFRRKFGAPRRLDEFERVWLTFAGIDGRVSVWLNGSFLGEHGSDRELEFEVTPLLRERNELVAEVESLEGTGGLYGEVALEVRCTAFLRAVKARWEDSRLHVHGEVVGMSDGALELYAVLDRYTIGYATIEPSTAGTPFEMTFEGIARQHGDQQSQLATVQVELVSGSTVWYAVDVRI
jgi:hypothetical protein